MLTAILPLILTATSRTPNFCLHFNGNQESTIPDCTALDTGKEVTAECWIKVDGDHPNQLFRYILSKNYGTNGWGVLMSVDYRLHATGLGHTEKQIPLHRWTHVAYACSDKKAKLYIDGQLAETQPVGEPLKNSDLQLCVGCSSFFGEPGHQFTNFGGFIDEVRIWDKAFTQSEIRSRMRRKISGRERHLVVYLPFDEGKGDLSANKTGKTPPLRLGRNFRPDEWDPTWVADSPFSPHARRR